MDEKYATDLFWNKSVIHRGPDSNSIQGQLISECLFDILNFPKHQWKFWQISTLEYKKWSNQQNKGTFLPKYNIHIVTRAIYYIKCLYFVDLNSFNILEQKIVKFFIGFLENLRYQKDILKLIDL